MQKVQQVCYAGYWRRKCFIGVMSVKQTSKPRKTRLICIHGPYIVWGQRSSVFLLHKWAEDAAAQLIIFKWCLYILHNAECLFHSYKQRLTFLVFFWAFFFFSSKLTVTYLPSLNPHSLHVLPSHQSSFRISDSAIPPALSFAPKRRGH